ncbi:hypothetical protein Barb6_00884 [Bacteroidales bacterium Barb6]|nr:hypothetical protein Barb6_00884 [Bacteroidales bacterium Barb6]
MDKRYVRVFAGLLLPVLIYSCASIGNPNGGPYDEKPPRLSGSNPLSGQLNYKGKKVVLLFDELVQLEKPSENVIITPPQLQMPIIQAVGSRVTVELRDTLKENTTYTIDFTNSIVDNNEKNVLENFSFAFSTGDVIDSLEVSGLLLDAGNLEPMAGITVGLHANPDDTAFVKEPFARTSRTNERGRFTIRNIAAGTYRLYALNDVNRDYRFDQPGEDIAFADSLITPAFEFAMRQDTVWADSVTVDSVKTVSYTHFTPDDIRLFLFKEKFARQYMLRPERTEPHLFTVRYNAPLDTVPLPIPVGFEPTDSSWYFIQTAEGNTSVHFWLTDSTVWQRDTLSVSFTYPRSDSLNVLRPQTDTLQLTMRHRPSENRSSRKRGKDEKEPVDFLEMNVNASASMHIYDTLFIAFSEPVTGLAKDLFRLDIKTDTLWEPVAFDFYPDTVNSLRYIISRSWKYGEHYRLEADSASVFDVYGKWNDAYSGTFGIRKEDEYGHLYLELSGLPDTLAFVELLDASDQPVRKAKVEDGGVLFMNLPPGKYYARLIADGNGNGIWDTGNYAAKQQPEKVFYYPKMIEVMTNWELTESWDILSVPVESQKPLEITKNKPKEVTKKNRDYKNEGRRSGNSGSSRSGELRF